MPEIVQFGVFEFESRGRELRRKGTRIRLQHQQFEILRLLVESHGELVTRDLIQKTLWPDDSFVDFERSINTAIMRLRHALRDDASSPTYIETVARSGYRLIPPVVEKPEATSVHTIRAIAILPLRDLTGTADSARFVDRLTDVLINALATGSELHVVSRTSAARYGDTTLSAREIARELDVQALVEGSVLRVDDRIRISIRLLDAVHDKRLWAETYDYDLKDMLQLEQEIADAIVRSATAAIKQGATTEKSRQIAPRANEFYIRGNFILSSDVTGQLGNAVKCYESAIEVEPAWAPPYAMLAECCRLRALFEHGSTEILLERTHTLAEKALQLDPNNALANATVGIVLAIHNWEWKEGLNRVRLALHTDPRSARIEVICAQVMLHMGRFDDAHRHVDSAIANDPSSMVLWAYRALTLYYARRYAECLHDYERILEQNPNFPLAVMGSAFALTELGRPQEALNAFDRLISATGWSIALVGKIQAHRRLGDTEEAKADLAELDRRYQEGACSPSILAWAHLAAGDGSASLAYLEKAVAAHDASLSLLLRLSPFDAIRDDAHYIGSLKQMQLES